MSAVESQELFLGLNDPDLIDRLTPYLQANFAVEGDGFRGGVKATEDISDGDRVAGLTKFERGVHGESDIDPIASADSLSIKADSVKGRQRTDKLHVLIEHGDRYLGSTGVQSLSGLGRLTLGISCVAIEAGGIRGQFIFTADDQRPKTVDAINEPFDPYWTLGEYDKFVNQEESPRHKSASDSAKALKNGLELLYTDNNFDPDNDAVMVASDFLMGAERDESGEVNSFNWQRTLRYLEAELGDRLYIVRLTSPSQQHFPLAYTLRAGGQALQFDTDEYFMMSTAYSLALQKAKKIQEIMKGMRVIELSTTSTTPVDELASFVFSGSKEV